MRNQTLRFSRVWSGILISFVLILGIAACNGSDPDASPDSITTPASDDPTPTKTATEEVTDTATQTDAVTEETTPTEIPQSTPTTEPTPTAEPEATPAPTPTPTATSEEAEDVSEVTIDIIDFAFDPEELTIPVGTTVRWINVGPTIHTTTSRSGIWDSAIMEQGDEFSYTFEEPGEYPYWCTLHPDMTATVNVE